MKHLGCVLWPKHFTRYGEILLAERRVIEDLIPTYETYWAISRDGLDFGRYVRNEWNVPFEVRKQEAINDALDWIALNVRNKRYG